MTELERAQAATIAELTQYLAEYQEICEGYNQRNAELREMVATMRKNLEGAIEVMEDQSRLNDDLLADVEFLRAQVDFLTAQLPK